MPIQINLECSFSAAREVEVSGKRGGASDFLAVRRRVLCDYFLDVMFAREHNEGLVLLGGVHSLFVRERRRFKYPPQIL